MTIVEILEDVRKIFIEVLDEEVLDIQMKTTADDIDEWDSLNHIQLIVGIERHFKIRFSSSEMQSYSNVGEMIEGIHEKL
jgi:acyl carrier protein